MAADARSYYVTLAHGQPGGTLWRLDAATDEVDQRGPAALVGNMQQIHTGHFLQQLSRHALRRPDARRAVAHLSGSTPGHRQQIRQ